MKSTSLHRITADGGNFIYKIIVRLLYYPLNFYNNRNPNKKIDPDLEIVSFKPKNLEKNYNHLDVISSPSRKLSDLYWMNLDWEELQKDLGEINICDLGCGTGNYYYKLQEYSKNKINSYIGFDINTHDEWKKINNEKIKFKKYDGKNLIDLIPKESNMIISQSAIEHFQEDISIFKQLKAFCDKTDQKVYQVHLFPSAECLRLYRFHGVRQYTPRTISKITKLYTSSAIKKLTILGGTNSNRVHIEYITGNDKRLNNIKVYNKILYSALKTDFESNKTNVANFYALIIS